MTKQSKPFSLLTKKKLLSAAALASLATASGAATQGIEHGVELGPVENGNAGFAICHKGRDMQVALPAMIGHLTHGDSIGSCGGGGGGGRGGL